MKKEYFVIYFGEDGISIKNYTKEETEKLIKDITEDSISTTPFVEEFKSNYYMDGGNYPIYQYMILKGSLITPKAVQVVTKYEL